jgi:hypothetical protein
LPLNGPIEDNISHPSNADLRGPSNRSVIEIPPRENPTVSISSLKNVLVPMIKSKEPMPSITIEAKSWSIVKPSLCGKESLLIVCGWDSSGEFRELFQH